MPPRRHDQSGGGANAISGRISDCGSEGKYFDFSDVLRPSSPDRFVMRILTGQDDLALIPSDMLPFVDEDDSQPLAP